MISVNQFSKYGGVAVGSAVTDYATFSVFFTLGSGMLPAQMIARIAGGLFSFFFNKYWSFGAQSPRALIIEGRRFLLLYGFSFLLALIILYTLTEQFEFTPYPAKIIADVVCFIVNFIIMRRYVFSGKQGLRDYFRRFFKPS